MKQEREHSGGPRCLSTILAKLADGMDLPHPSSQDPERYKQQVLAAAAPRLVLRAPVLKKKALLNEARAHTLQRCCCCCCCRCCRSRRHSRDGLCLKVEYDAEAVAGVNDHLLGLFLGRQAGLWADWAHGIC